ncbi:MAG: proline/glycine betaine ABC transporter permease, partial [bacterium]
MAEQDEMDVVAASDIEVDRAALDASIEEFAGESGDYYIRSFHRIHSSTGALPSTFNLFAALLGPVWAAARAVWGMFWGFLILEIIAWVQIGRGWWGNPGASFLDRAAKQRERADGFLERAKDALSSGEDPGRFEKLADNLTAAAEKSELQGIAANAESVKILLTGLGLLLVIKLVQGFYADAVYEKQYSRWRIDPRAVESGRKLRNIVLGVVLTLIIAPLTVYDFTISSPLEILAAFPERQISALFIDGENETLYTHLAVWLEARIDAAAIAGGGAFDSVTAAVRSILNAVGLMLIGTPWPVVMVVICVVAWRAAGARVAIFTGAALAYTALLGYWEISMETVALVGAAVIICVTFGIPLGIW